MHCHAVIMDAPDHARRVPAAVGHGNYWAGAPSAEGGFEGGQAAADHVGLPQAGAAGGPLGVHRGADSLQRGERVGDPGAVGRALRDLLAQGVQRLRQVIGAPLDVGPPGGASPAASPPGASATLIASCRVEPLAYASMSRDRKSAAAADRRRPDRAIHTITPARTRTPSRTHSQVRLVPEEVPGDVAVCIYR